ncbi:TPA: hypothetical protein IAC10_11525 [Candidatus Scatousia excrementigallinarum]|uniref:Transposase n=1 Tax=Candidatus Scatousia excrementigallinarum TaxID=2840935 RepID=A0A9D1F0L5_9BACT|nr:hypothetical protein [Candidatus Scatousia excrementigallinarum]
MKERFEYIEDENEYLKKIRCLSSSGRAKERQKAIIVAELRQTFPLRILLRISQLPRSTFYYHLKASCIDKHRTDKHAIMEVFERNENCYGYR